MSYVDRIAMEAAYRMDKLTYEDVMNRLNFSKSKKEGLTNNVFLAAQMNADLQTSLLSMSNTLSPKAKEQYQLLAATNDLEKQYKELVGDSKAVSDMHYARYFAWSLGALVLIIVLVRSSRNKSS
jgi:hypothetical protein